MNAKPDRVTLIRETQRIEVEYDNLPGLDWAAVAATECYVENVDELQQLGYCGVQFETIHIRVREHYGRENVYTYIFKLVK